MNILHFTTTSFWGNGPRVHGSCAAIRTRIVSHVTFIMQSVYAQDARDRRENTLVNQYLHLESFPGWRIGVLMMKLFVFLQDARAPRTDDVRLLLNKNKLRKKFCRKNVQLCKLRTIYLWSGITIDTISMSFSTQIKASNCSFPETRL